MERHLDPRVFANYSMRADPLPLLDLLRSFHARGNRMFVDVAWTWRGRGVDKEDMLFIQRLWARVRWANHTYRFSGDDFATPTSSSKFVSFAI